MRIGTTAMTAGLLALGACAPARDTLKVVERIPLPDSASVALAVDEAGGFHVAGPDGVLYLGGEPGADPPAATPLELGGPSARIGAAGGRAFFRSPSALVSSGAAGALEARTRETSAAALDPRARYLFTTIAHGEVVAHDPGTLEAIWGWVGLGATAAALAVSPEGDRVYIGSDPCDDPPSPALLVRDLQTGRVLRRLPAREAIRALHAGDGGALFVATADGAGRGHLLALEWVDGEPRTRWQRSLDGLGLTPPVRLRLDPAGRRLAVLAGNEEAGLHLLEVETGHDLDRLSGRLLDFDFDPAGRLWVLYPGVLARVE